MPNHTIYIRKEDKPKWDAIGDKSGWVRERLNDVPTLDIIQARLAIVPKPPELSDLRWLQHLKDHGIDLADTSVDSNPDWGAQ